jgi:hypothetical protein
MSTCIPLTSTLSNRVLFAISIACLGVTGLAYAAGGNNTCPVGVAKGLSLNDEFGPGSSDLTRCLERRHNVRVVMQVNKFCRDAVSNAD